MIAFEAAVESLASVMLRSPIMLSTAGPKIGSCDIFFVQPVTPSSIAREYMMTELRMLDVIAFSLRMSPPGADYCSMQGQDGRRSLHSSHPGNSTPQPARKRGRRRCTSGVFAHIGVARWSR